MIRICCRCHRVETAGLWGPGPIEVASERVTHGFCPDCYTTVMAEIETYGRKQSRGALVATTWISVAGASAPCA